MTNDEEIEALKPRHHKTGMVLKPLFLHRLSSVNPQSYKNLQWRELRLGYGQAEQNSKRNAYSLFNRKTS